MIKSIFTIEKMVLGTCIANPHAWKYLFRYSGEENFIDGKCLAIIHAAHALIDEGKCPERHAFLAPTTGIDDKYLDKLVVFACDHTQFAECIKMLKTSRKGSSRLTKTSSSEQTKTPFPKKAVRLSHQSTPRAQRNSAS